LDFNFVKMHHPREWWKCCDQKSTLFMTWLSGVQCKNGSNKISLVGVSRDLPTSQITWIIIIILVVSTLQNTFRKMQLWVKSPLFHVTHKQLILFVAMYPPGGETRIHQPMIQHGSGSGRVQVFTVCWLYDAFTGLMCVFILKDAKSSITELLILVQTLLHWFRHSNQGQYSRLLIW